MSPTPPGLSSAHRMTLRAIERLLAERGVPPTYRELAAERGLSISTIAEHVRELTRSGVMKRIPSKSGGILLDTLPERFLRECRHKISEGGCSRKSVIGLIRRVHMLHELLSREPDYKVARFTGFPLDVIKELKDETGKGNDGANAPGIPMSQGGPRCQDSRR